jgi:class 3 adenylate cyclase
MTNSPHVFISYLREDQRLVSELCRELARRSVTVWLDREKIHPGERWQVAIRRAIEDGAFFIACFSAAYGARGRSYMNVELTMAVEQLRSKPVDRAWFIPVLFEGGNVPDRPIGGGETLRDMQWVDLAEDWEGGIRRILGVILPAGMPRPESLSEARLREIRVLLVGDVVAYTAISEMIDEKGFFGNLTLMQSLATKAIVEHEGELFVHAGDGFIAGFEQAQNAVGCALAIQEEMSRSAKLEQIRLRIGLAAGPIVRSRHGDVQGLAVHLAARVCSIARGGQVLAAESVILLGVGRNRHIKEQGPQILKGISEPVHIFEVT